VKSNRSAIGAAVSVFAANGSQTQWVLSQSSFISQSDRRLHFGLDQERKIQRLLVQWPSGLREAFPGSEANRTLLLVEGSGQSTQMEDTH
jgi:hypothetical protein